MSVRNHAIWIFILFGLTTCELERSNFNAKYIPYTQAFQEATGYNLLEPSQSYILPGTLTEISGLTLVDDSTVACVEDESGVIFLYSLSKGKMIDQIRFSGPGDFEGIELVGDDVYVLKSNGNLYEYSLSQQTTNTIKTPLTRRNNTEGLAYDSANHRLLIVCKGAAGLKNQDIKGKAIYAYSLSQGFIPDPVLVITQEDLIKWNESQPPELKISKNRFSFMPSGIAFDPQGDIYLVATVGKLLMVLSADGKIKHGIPISPRVFRQPEGICFTSRGDLIVSNEGQDGSGRIQVFYKGLKDRRNEGPKD